MKSLPTIRVKRFHIIVIALFALCILDVAATQFEVSNGLANEWNPFGVLLIEAGWLSVWIYKVGAAVAVVSFARQLSKHTWTRMLVHFSTGLYLVIGVCHLVLLSIQPSI